VAAPTLVGKNRRVARRANGTLNSLDISTNTSVHWWTGLPVDENGWHDIDAILMADGKYQNARFVYVDSVNGSDTPSVLYYTKDDGRFDTVIGSTPTNPVGTPSAFQTVGAAREYIRYGYSDVLLLKRGGTYTEWLRAGTTNGEAYDEPGMVTAYGTGARPILKAPMSCSIAYRTGETTVVDGITLYADSSTLNYFFISHLHYKPVKIYDPTDPLWDYNTPIGVDDAGNARNLGTDIWWEGCQFDYSILPLDNKIYDRTDTYSYRRMVRRCGFHEHYALGFIAGGALHILGTADSLFEEVVSYRGGWLGEDYTSYHGGLTRTGGHNHGFYLSRDCPGLQVVECMLGDSSATGVQMRHGGKLKNTFFWRCMYGAALDGPVCESSYNVFTEPPAADGAEVDYVYAFWLRGNGWLQNSQTPMPSVTHFCHHNLFTAFNVESVPLDANYTIRLGTGQPIVGATFDVTSEDNVFYNWVSTNADFSLRDGNADVVKTTVHRRNKHHNTNSTALIGRINGQSSWADTWEDNEYDVVATKPYRLDSTLSTHAEWVTATNDTSQNTTLTFPSPDRTVAQYMTSIGFDGEDGHDLFVRAYQNNKVNWNPNLTASAINTYFRAGFGMLEPTE
jgi:hypothetical protein